MNGAISLLVFRKYANVDYALSDFVNLGVIFFEATNFTKLLIRKTEKFIIDPSGKGRRMKEWVQVPYDYKKHWKK